MERFYIKKLLETTQARTKYKRFLHSRAASNAIIVTIVLVFLYLLISLYFTKHFLFHTVINGIDVSLKAPNKTEASIDQYVADYELCLIDRNGATEILSGQDMGLEYNEKNSVNSLYRLQKSFRWFISVFKNQQYQVKDFYRYDDALVDGLIDRLACLNNDCIKSRDVSFQYKDGAYEVVKEIYGNIINKEKLKKAVKTAIMQGKRELNLEEEYCYIYPKYTLKSEKTWETLNLLNKYVSTKVIYQIGSKSETLDGSIISKWLNLDEDLNIEINNTAIKNYVAELSHNYDTVGKERIFLSSMNKAVTVKGGVYGWKIDREAEVNALLNNVKAGEYTQREPIYAQTALSREENDIGDTYVEINITRQYLWFYKNGKLVTEGPVVTGNPNKGNATTTGTHKIIYKQNFATLSGANYEVKVTYWMPFYGNMGIHDASWRNSFGGDIYKRNGTHGCVNAPYSLAKKIFENIEDGIPVVVYQE